MRPSNDVSRMSQLRDHNMFQKTDHLYEPLRNAIRKSAVMPSNIYHSFSVKQNDLQTSRLSKDVKTFNSKEVQNIKRNIFIPVNKELTPTHNLNKVIGKRFKAVGVQEKVLDPLTPEEFSRVRSGVTEQIVYEIADQPTSSFNIYTHRNTHLQIPLANHQIHNRRVSSPPVTVRFTHQVGGNIQKNPSQQKIIAPLINLRNSISQKEVKNNVELTRIPSIKRLDSTSAFNSNILEGGEKSKAYDFKQSDVSSERFSLKSKQMEKDGYKYNLFSMIDEAGNNGCKTGCCSSNEIIASKPKPPNSWF